MLKKALFSLMLLSTTMASAQILSVNDAKVKFEGTAEYRGGDPKEGNPDGNFFSHEAIWYNPIFSPLQKLGVEVHHQSNNGGGNGVWNNYFRFGVNGMKVFLLPGKTRGIALTANLYGEGSQYGIHHFDGVLSSLFMFSMKQNDSRGVGFVYLLNNPSHMFALPIFTWNRKFNEHWSLNWMTWLGDFSYNFNQKLRLTASYGFGFERYWIKYNDEKCMANQILATPCLSFNYIPSKHVTVGVSGGYQIAFMGSLFNENGTDYIKKLDTHIEPFASAKVAIRY